MADIVGSAYRSIRPFDVSSMLGPGPGAVAAAREKLSATDALAELAYPAIGEALRGASQVGDAVRRVSWREYASSNIAFPDVGDVLRQVDALADQVRAWLQLRSGIENLAVGGALDSMRSCSSAFEAASGAVSAGGLRDALASRPSLADLASLAREQEGDSEKLGCLIADLLEAARPSADVSADTAALAMTPELSQRLSTTKTLRDDLKAMSPAARILFWIMLLDVLVNILQLVPNSNESAEAFQEQVTRQIAAVGDALVTMHTRPPLVVNDELVLKRGKGEGGTRCVIPAGTALRVEGKSGRWLLVEVTDVRTRKPIQGWVLKHHLCR